MAEEQRRSNELERIANENEREAYYEDMIQKVENDYFKGEKGDKGDKGDIGLSNTLTIGTVNKGDNAEATLTGESPNQILNLTLPKGDKGEQGIQGIQGIQGPKGPKGDKGDAFKYSDFTQEQLEGLRGPQGPQGVRGPQGVTGATGPQGEKGDTGNIGPANTLTIGDVSKGDNAEATITGTSPNQTLNLVLPKGDAFTYEDFTKEQLEGLTGPKGEDYIITDEDYDVIENQVKTDLQPILEEIENTANRAEVISKGKSQSIVRKTWAEMEIWLRDVANKGILIPGDNLWIEAHYTDETETERQPDFWITKVLEEPNEKGYYYEFSPLESEKPDLTDYAKKEQFVTLTQTEYDDLTEKSANTYYFIIEEE